MRLGVQQRNVHLPDVCSPDIGSHRIVYILAPFLRSFLFPPEPSHLRARIKIVSENIFSINAVYRNFTFPLHCYCYFLSDFYRIYRLSHVNRTGPIMTECVFASRKRGIEYFKKVGDRKVKVIRYS